jgi:hypothetical protein
MASRPINALIAIASSLLPIPVLVLTDRLNQVCGDSMCGLFSGILIVAALAVATVVFVVRSARRHETPGWLRFIPLALWLLVFMPLPF